MGECLVCGKNVAFTDQDEHLKANHLGPHYFWFAARQFKTEKPSMLVAELKALVGCASGYHLYEEREGGDVPHSDGVAVDLTRSPHFWAAPPATMFG